MGPPADLVQKPIQTRALLREYLDMCLRKYTFWMHTLDHGEWWHEMNCYFFCFSDTVSF